MRITVHGQHVSIDPGTEWVADAMDPATETQLGLYLRSVEHGIYLNVRTQEAGGHPLTLEGMAALLREQAWASAPSDEVTEVADDLAIALGTFETTGMRGEVVLEIFVTDGRTVANLAGPGERGVIASVTPAARRLARTVRFG
jgi:hypothetical protein